MNASQSSELTLLGDIGGTNCRLALQNAAGAFLHRANYETDDFPSPREAIKRFIEDNHAAMPKRAVLALAGPIDGDVIQLTNSPWRFERKALMTALGLDQLLLVNDLAAQGRGVLDLAAQDFTIVGPDITLPLHKTVALVGPGTGLGVSLLEPDDDIRVHATEGGHVGFAPNDDVEVEMLRLWRRHIGNVTNEHVSSGPGIVRIYRALGALKDQHVEPIDGPEIFRRALTEDDALCRETAERFAKILGSVSADIVLIQGASTLVLVGGIVNTLAPILAQGGFRARFEQRGPRPGYLRETPSLIATASDLGLKGAGALVRDTTTQIQRRRGRK